MGKWGLRNWCPYKMGKSGSRHTHGKNTMWWWRQRSGDASISQGTPKMPSKPPELGKGHRRDSLAALGGNPPCRQSSSSAADNAFLWFKPPGLWPLMWQPPETNTLRFSFSFLTNVSLGSCTSGCAELIPFTDLWKESLWDEVSQPILAKSLPKCV